MLTFYDYLSSLSKTNTELLLIFEAETILIFLFFYLFNMYIWKPVQSILNTKMMLTQILFYS